MAFQSAPNMAEAVIHGTMGGRPVVNVLGFLYPGGYSSSNLQDLADAIDTWWGTEMLQWLSSSYTYVETVVRGLESQNDLTATANAETGAGADTGASTANNVALVVTHRSGLTGRSARGRTYVGGLPSSALQNAVEVKGTFASNIENSFNDLLTAISGTGWAFAVISRRAGGAPRPVAVAFIVNVIAVRNTKIDSQRGRLDVGH